MITKISPEMLDVACGCYRLPFATSHRSNGGLRNTRGGTHVSSIGGKTFELHYTQKFFNEGFGLTVFEMPFGNTAEEIRSFLTDKLSNARTQKTDCGLNVFSKYFAAIEQIKTEDNARGAANITSVLTASSSKSKSPKGKSTVGGARASDVAPSSSDNGAWRAVRSAFYAKSFLDVYRKYADHLLEMRDEISSFTEAEESMLKFLTTMNDVARTENNVGCSTRDSAFYAGLIIMRNNQDLAIKDIVDDVYHLADVENAKKTGRSVSLMSKLIRSGCDSSIVFGQQARHSTYANNANNANSDSNVRKDLLKIENPEVLDKALQDLDMIEENITKIERDVKKRAESITISSKIEFASKPQDRFDRYMKRQVSCTALSTQLKECLKETVPQNPKLQKLKEDELAQLQQTPSPGKAAVLNSGNQKQKGDQEEKEDGSVIDFPEQTRFLSGDNDHQKDNQKDQEEKEDGSVIDFPEQTRFLSGDNDHQKDNQKDQDAKKESKGWSFWSLLDMIKSAMRSIFESIRDFFCSSKKDDNKPGSNVGEVSSVLVADSSRGTGDDVYERDISIMGYC